MILHVRDIDGRHFSRLIYCNRHYTVDVTTPDNHHLFNFKVEGASLAGDRVSLLVLDPYGDDTLPQSIRDRVFGKNPYTLAIDRKTGNICIATFEEDPDHGLCLCVERWMPSHVRSEEDAYQIPSHFKKRLNELLSKKRPYRCHIEPSALEQFIDQEEGYSHLHRNVVFSFEFGRGAMLEVWGDSYRKVGRWS